ncbi:F-box domain-containing protein [Meloidogyne graminicola]|uniref:F-box domain-containing protein n=1 Tax=Meloidogyne graminicola TaxID=189291 RepID=A0A8S9ZU19_9BILA|nr:F-box domain-containing protein [Meloidogyne graminicola]
MEYLPAEIQLKILQNLTFVELFSIKQTCHHFYNFINKYEGSLSRKKFNNILFDIVSNAKQINLVKIDFLLNDELLKKWQFVLEKQIPLYLNAGAVFTLKQTLNLLFFTEGDSFLSGVSNQKNDFTLQLPLYPKSIDELKILRFYLKKFFSCNVEYLNFNKFLFNPEMIELLFDSEEIKKLKIKCKIADLCFYNSKIDLFKFTLEHLVIDKHLWIHFDLNNNLQIDYNVLLNILLNGGNKIPEVVLYPFDGNIRLYNLLVEQIEETKDLTKMMTKITFDCINCPISSLIVKGIIKKEYNNIKYFELLNTHNSMIKFSVKWRCLHNNKFVNEIKITTQ